MDFIRPEDIDPSVALAIGVIIDTALEQGGLAYGRKFMIDALNRQRDNIDEAIRLLQLPDDAPIEGLRFETEIYNELRRQGISTVAELAVVTPERLATFPQFGESKVDTVLGMLVAIGRRLP